MNLSLTFGDFGKMCSGDAEEGLVLSVTVRLGLVRQGLDGGLIGGSRALVVERHGTIAF